jgi:hypothetical protein
MALILDRGSASRHRCHSTPHKRGSAAFKEIVGKESGKRLPRLQPERKEKYRNGQRRANHEQHPKLSKLSRDLKPKKSL